MEYLCVGSYTRILTSCAIPAEQKYEPFCEKTMMSLCSEDAACFTYKTANGNDVIYSSSSFNNICSSRQNLPGEVMRMAQNKDPRLIEQYFIRNIIPALDEGKKQNAVLALKNVILKDKSIPDSTELGTLVKLKKEELKTKNEFVLPEFLTDIFIYAVTHTTNKTGANFTKSIKKNYYSAYDGEKDSIKLYEMPKPKIVQAIPPTSKGNFNTVFSQVLCENLDIAGYNDFQIYCLKFDDFDFNYNGLLTHLRYNIGFYVYSRSQIQEYLNDEKLHMLAYDAASSLKEKYSVKNMPFDNELGELLLYIFLEQVLKAPKLMSNVEINNYEDSIRSKSEGIHLLTTDGATPFNQIVLGVSLIKSDLRNTIDEIFLKSKNLKEKKKHERKFIESNIFLKTFPDSVSAQLEAIILPSESEEKKPETAFGIFLGYSMDDMPKKDISINEYQNKVLEKLKNDLLECKPYIKSKISEYGLEGHSFYIYLLPFADADKDKTAIMRSLLLCGGEEI